MRLRAVSDAALNSPVGASGADADDVVLQRLHISFASYGPIAVARLGGVSVSCLAQSRHGRDYTPVAPDWVAPRPARPQHEALSHWPLESAGQFVGGRTVNLA